MNDLIIRYGIEQRYKRTAVFTSLFLMAISAGISILQALHQPLGFYFYLGISGILVGLITVLMFTVWSKETKIELTSQIMGFNIPSQKINGSISWENITHIGMGLSHLSLKTNANRDFKIDLENLKYADIKRIKSKIIEVCETRGITFQNE